MIVIMQNVGIVGVSNTLERICLSGRSTRANWREVFLGHEPHTALMLVR